MHLFHKISAQDASGSSTAPLETSINSILSKRKKALKEQGGYETAPGQPYMRIGPSKDPMPLVGLGTWKAEPGQVYEAVKTAIRCGYRHIDCASYYQNEHEVGRALREVLAEGWVRREELFIVSKLWNSDHGASRVRPALQRTLRDLQLTHLDLYLIHWPCTGNRGEQVSPPLSETWAALEGAVDAGLTRHIGVSNFGPAKLGALLRGARIPPAVVQVEMHPYWRNQPVVDFCQSRGIALTAFSPLGSPDSSALLKRVEDPAVPKLLEHPTVKQIAGHHGKTPAQVLIRWSLERGIAVLPKSVNPDRIRSNLQGAVDFALSGEEMRELSTIGHQKRQVDGGVWVNATTGPYRTVEELWA